MTTVLITGATSGIGLALAQRYAAQGVLVVLVGRRPHAELDQAFFTPERYCRADLAQPGCQDVIAGWLTDQGIGEVDVLIHNAGLGYVGAIGDQSPADIEALFHVNLKTPVALTHRLLPLLTPTAHIVFISSVAAVLPSPEYAVYSATKAGLDAFARNLRLELHAMGSAQQIQVIHAGATRTEMHAKAGLPADRISANFADPADVAAAITRAVARDRRRQTIGLSNKLGYHALQWGDTSVDRVMRRQARGRAGADRTNRPLETPERPHVLITGAADGIGRALALEWARRGAMITGVDVDAARAAAVRDELHALECDAQFILGNLSHAAEIEAIVDAVAQRPPVTVMVHNAGINAVGPFAEIDLGRQQAVLDINLRAPLLLTRGLLAENRLSRGGSVVCIASLSRFVGYPGAAVYAASKDGLASYARSLGVALADADIDVLTVFPGPTRTAHARRYSPDNSREAKRMPPEELARRIVDATDARKLRLIPGVANRVFAAAGRLAPWLTDRIMQRTIFDKLVAAPIPPSE
jgi:cyclic-di-GMP-binding biofilm dispersal mediator protein